MRAPFLGLCMISRRTRDTIDLTNGIAIEIHTASFRTTRGLHDRDRDL